MVWVLVGVRRAEDTLRHPTRGPEEGGRSIRGFRMTTSPLVQGGIKFQLNFSRRARLQKNKFKPNKQSTAVECRAAEQSSLAHSIVSGR